MQSVEDVPSALSPERLKKKIDALQTAIEKIADAINPDPDAPAMRLHELVTRACELIELGKKAVPTPPPKAPAPKPPHKNVIPASEIDLSMERFPGNKFGERATPMVQKFPADLNLKGGERFYNAKSGEWLRVVGFLTSRSKFNIVCANSSKLEREGTTFIPTELKVFAKEFVIEKALGDDAGKQRRVERIKGQAQQMRMTYEQITNPFRLILRHTSSLVNIYDINPSARKNPIVVEDHDCTRWVITEERLRENIEHGDPNTTSLFEMAYDTCIGRTNGDVSDFDPADLKRFGAGSVFIPGNSRDGRPQEPSRMDFIRMGIYPVCIKKKAEQRGVKRGRYE